MNRVSVLYQEFFNESGERREKLFAGYGRCGSRSRGWGYGRYSDRRRRRLRDGAVRADFFDADFIILSIDGNDKFAPCSLLLIIS